MVKSGLLFKMVHLFGGTGRADCLFWIANFVLSVLINVHEVWSFNLDSSVPIIKTSQNQSYFGFSVAQHYISENNPSRHVILVGAPRENISTLQVSEPGAVYQCPLSPLNNDCTRIIVDEQRSAGFDKSNQWLGVSLSSQNSPNGTAIACAHRYKKTGPSYVWGQGICFSLTNTLEEDSVVYEPCSAKPVDKAHEEYGFCQTGTSVAYHENGDILFGTPGPFNWQGVLFKYRPPASIWEEQEWYESKNDTRIPSNSYLGMAVKIGERIFENGSPAYIGGAPKSHGSGEVFLFRQGSNMQLEYVQRLLGEQFYSGFGYALIVGDFNNDGKNDLVVGAPFYHEQGIGGAIYIYFNKRGGFTSKPVKITSRRMKEAECETLKCYDARFGFALATIGDLDRDGYQDFVVGAPFEGNGAVYVFRGSPTSKIDTYSQRISAADVAGANLKSFGYSLSGGNDVDNNTYPDLVIGAYQSDSVVILRARPVVNIIATLESDPRQINPKRTNCSDGKAFNCMTIKVCLRFTAEPKDRYPGRLRINYRLEAEKFTGSKVIRVFFGDVVDNFVVENTVNMKEQSQQTLECASHAAYLRKNIRDFLSPIAFRLTYELSNSTQPRMTSGQPLPDFYSYPVLNQTTSHKDLQVSFIKNCGTDDICKSNLKLSATLQLPQESNGDYLLKLGEVPELRMTVSVTNDGEDAHETVLWVTLPENIILIGTESKGNNLLCTPVENKLECDVGNPVAEKETVSLVIRLSPNRLSSAQNKISIDVLVNTTSTEQDVRDNSISLQIAVSTIVDLAVIGSSDPKTAYYEKGGGQLDYKPTNEEDIGPEIIHKFEVKNTGKVTVQESDLTITWPLHVINSANQKLYLLYIMEKPQVNGNSRQQEGARCRVDTKFVNPENVKVKVSNPESIKSNDGGAGDPKQLVRRKRTTTQNFEPGIGDLVCGKTSSIECLTIKCEVFELRPAESVLISIRSRLWNRTVSSMFPDAYELLVRSTASIAIYETGLKIKQSNTANDIGQAGTKLMSSAKKPHGVALWIIIVSVCAGILLLVGLVILLWKCGFFTRNRPEQFPQHQAVVTKSVDEEENSDGRDLEN